MTDQPAKAKHPKGLYVLFFTEMWERFGFYTMLAIFMLYLDEYFHFESKGQLYGTFLALVYFTPVVGGIIADKWLGFRRTIMAGAVLMAIGYGLMSVPIAEDSHKETVVLAAEQDYAGRLESYEQRYKAFQEETKVRGGQEKFSEERPKYEGPGRTARRPIFYLALFFLVIGNGLFKPNISVMVGNLYAEGNPLKDSAFNIFYMGINIGALGAGLAAASLRHTLGWEFAFGAAAVGMVISLITFLAFRKHIEHAEIGKKSATSLVTEEKLTPEAERSRIIALLTIFGIVILFWMSFHQNGYTMVLWARDSTAPVFGWQIPAELFASLNPLFVVACTPLVVGFWAMFRKKGKEPSTPGKIGIGMLLTAAAFLILAVAGQMGGDYGRVSVNWLVSAYLVVTIGELCLSPMGLSFVSKVAPTRMRGLMMGGWFAATATGNYLSGLIGFLWEKWDHSSFFYFLVGASIFAAIILRLNLKRLKAATGGQ